MINLTCIDCGKEFYLKDKEIKFYEDQGYALPKRCYYHRKRKKKSKVSKARSSIVLVWDKR